MDVIKLEIVIEDEDLENIIDAGMQGGINWWCEQALCNGEDCWKEAGSVISSGAEIELIDRDGARHFIDKQKILLAMEDCCGEVELFIDHNNVKFLNTEEFDTGIADNIIRKAAGLDG